jgi:hypothetical protein
MIWQGWAKDFGHITRVANDPENSPANRTASYLISEKELENVFKSFIIAH